MEYEEYIKKRFGRLPEENKRNVIGVMQKYGDNHWWESEDLIEIAMYQLFEPVTIVSFDMFHEGLEKLLDRKIEIHELGINAEGLREEAVYAIKRLKTGIGISDEQRETANRKSRNVLKDFCNRYGTIFNEIDISTDKRDENGIDRSGEDGWLN